MSWCPQCKTEYREGFTVCADCGATLVTQPPEEEPVQPDWAMSAFGALPALREPVLLTEISDTVDLRMLVDMLGSMGIAAAVQEDSTGNYGRLYMGVSPYARRIYVEQAQLPEARQLLEEYFSPEESSEALEEDVENSSGEDSLPPEQEEAPVSTGGWNARGTAMRVVILLFAGSIILGVVFSLLLTIAGNLR